MDYTGICRICGNEITFNSNNIYPLGIHLVTNHPEVEMAHFMIDSTSQSKVSSSSSKKSVYQPKRRKSSETQRNLYKTTVETWRPGAAPITCPKCNCTGQPIIRKQRNKVANNPIGAFFLLGCWPLCFLPMVMCGSTIITVCCKRCGYCIGTYNPKQGKLIPNPNHEDMENSDSPRCNC